jgi:hypothetical protein
MSNKSLDATVFAAFVAFLCIPGCGRAPDAYGVRTQGAGWSSVVRDALPGIHEGSVFCVTLSAGPPEGLVFVVWSDLPGGYNGHGQGSAVGASYDGYLTPNNGRRIEIRAKTLDGKSGNITIAGVDYDFAKGSMFLVSARTEPPTVEQVSFDMSQFPDANFGEFGKSVPQIRDFFEKHKKDGEKSK